MSEKHVYPRWIVPDGLDTSGFDFNWRPSRYDPPYVHQFGTQHQKTGGPRWVEPGATDPKYHDAQIAIALPHNNWDIPKDIDTNGFDFSWHPDSTEEPYIYQFGTQWQRTGGPKYIVPGATHIKYMDIMGVKALPNNNWVVPGDIDTTDFDFSWHPDSTEEPYIYQFGTQWQRTGGPRYIVPGATQIKYVDVMKARALPNNNWVIPEGIDKEGFDWSWHPDSTEEPYIHVFSTRWVPRGGPRYYVDGAKDFKYYDKPGDPIAISSPNWRFWSIPENIDSANFDWTWQPPLTETEPYIYQFGTQWQRTGGPRYIVPGATQIKYMDVMRVRALPHSNWVVSEEIQRLAADIIDFDKSWHPDSTEEPHIYAWGNQWRTAEETPTILYTAPGASKFKYMNNTIANLSLPPLDVVFVSNGEVGAEDRYTRLVEHAKKYGNTVHWIKGIKGRENALYKAALTSQTDWWWCVPAKLWVDDNFDLGWHPNPWIEPTHWITHAVNPVNGLIYGHQAAVCYYKQHIIDTYKNNSWGLDFTMSAPHDIHPVVSGVAQYNSDPWMTWRTAFREVIKLKHNIETNKDDAQSKQRLSIWLEIAEGENSQWSILGANDGINYYDSVSHDPDALQLSFKWNWLQDKWNELNYKL